MQLAVKIWAILRREFPPPDRINLEDDQDSIIGTLVSERFEDLSSMDRIKILWDILDANLSPEERRRIVTIITLTPLEAAEHTAASLI